MVRRRFTDKEKNNIVKSYVLDEVHTVTQLSTIYKCSRGMIKNLLDTQKIPIRVQSEAQRKSKDVDKKDEKRFWKKVCIKSKDECWEWVASIDTCGYGRFAFRKILLSAHRFAWTISFGKIPISMQVLHTCDNPSCCNPGHLFLGTHQDNMIDRNNKGRSKGGSNKGEENPRSRFKVKDIFKIRKMLKKGYKQKEISLIFNTSQAVISGIKTKKYWRHL